MGFKVSTKGTYGLRLMLDLGTFYNERLVSVKEIATRQGISEKYLEQIVNLLNKGGFLESVRGAFGGYKLAIAPAEITVGMILRVLEGELSPTKCVAGDDCGCTESENCATVGVWQGIKDAVDNVVDNITLADLLKDYTLDQKWNCNVK